MPRRRSPADAERAMLAPLVPVPKPGDRSATHDRRGSVEAVRSLLRTGPGGGHCPTPVAQGHGMVVIPGTMVGQDLRNVG